MNTNYVFEKSPSDEGGLNRLEYVLKNGRALNVYGALKELNEAQVQMKELQSELDAYKAHISYLRIGIKDAHSEGQKNAGRSPSDFRWCNSNAKYLFDQTQAQSLSRIKAQAINDLISEHSYSASIDGIATRVICQDDAEKYANKIGDNNE